MKTLGSLIEELQSLVRQGVDENTPVKLATQPSYPFEYEVGEIVTCTLGEDDQEFVYISEGDNQQYLAGAVASELGWR